MPDSNTLQFSVLSINSFFKDFNLIVAGKYLKRICAYMLIAVNKSLARTLKWLSVYLNEKSTNRKTLRLHYEFILMP